MEGQWWGPQAFATHTSIKLALGRHEHVRGESSCWRARGMVDFDVVKDFVLGPVKTVWDELRQRPE